MEGIVSNYVCFNLNYAGNLITCVTSASSNFSPAKTSAAAIASTLLITTGGAKDRSTETGG